MLALIPAASEVTELPVILLSNFKFLSSQEVLCKFDSLTNDENLHHERAVGFDRVGLKV